MHSHNDTLQADAAALQKLETRLSDLRRETEAQRKQIETFKREAANAQKLLILKDEEVHNSEQNIQLLGTEFKQIKEQMAERDTQLKLLSKQLAESRGMCADLQARCDRAEKQLRLEQTARLKAIKDKELLVKANTALEHEVSLIN